MLQRLQDDYLLTKHDTFNYRTMYTIFFRIFGFNAWFELVCACTCACVCLYDKSIHLLLLIDVCVTKLNWIVCNFQSSSYSSRHFAFWHSGIFAICVTLPQFIDGIFVSHAKLITPEKSWELQNWCTSVDLGFFWGEGTWGELFLGALLIRRAFSMFQSELPP